MKLSARNVLPGTVTKLTKGAVNAEVDLALKGGGEIAAIITNQSAERLDLKKGQNAFAIIKASSVILGKELHSAKLSTRNILCGTVTAVKTGAVNSEVELKIGDGAVLTAIITNESAQSLGFKVGEHACAAFKASSVILGVE